LNARAPAQVADPSFRILQDIAKDLAKGDISFPTFSAATVEVRKALEDPNVNADKLARVVSREPLLSAKIVRMANSVALNPSGRAVADVRTAVIRVGQSNVRSVAVAVAYEQLRADKDLQKHRARAEAAWKHSANVAAHAYVIAKLARLSPDEAMFAGLVHDIGYYYLLSLSSRYPELEGHEDALDDVLRNWHASVGQTVLHSFSLTPAVMEAVGDHEAGTYNMPPAAMKDVVCLANLVCDATNPIRPQSRPPIELDEPELIAYLAAATEQLGSLQAILHN